MHRKWAFSPQFMHSRSFFSSSSAPLLMPLEHDMAGTSAGCGEAASAQDAVEKATDQEVVRDNMRQHKAANCGDEHDKIYSAACFRVPSEADLIQMTPHEGHSADSKLIELSSDC